MNILFTKNAFQDYQYWQEKDKKILKRINMLVLDVTRNGADTGIGKPEQLRGNLQGCYSRRINDRHCLVYKIDNNILYVLSCRYHYEK